MKARLFKRLKVINLLSQRALDKDKYKKCERLQDRASLIEYFFESQPIINRDIKI